MPSIVLLLRRRFVLFLCPLIALGILGGLWHLLGNSVSAQAKNRASIAAEKVRPELEAALKKKDLRFGAPIFVRIFKESNELEVWVQREPEAVTRDDPPGKGGPEFELFRTYKICYWSGNLGPKVKQGDGQAPEGFYVVSRGRMNPLSSYHLSFDLGYPNAYDHAHKRTGNYLMVHGSCVSIGCYAMTDERIEEIYTLADAALAGGQKYFRVHCFPFRMTDKRMEKAANKEDEKQWLSFWGNLREGYDRFEQKKLPPDVKVEDGKYAFDE